MSPVKKTGLFAYTGAVTGNMTRSGIALLPVNLASIGGAAIWGWVISITGVTSLAYVYARLVTKDPQQGGLIIYAGEISPTFGFQAGALYYHANWIGNLVTGAIAVSYLFTFFPILNNPVPAGIVYIAIVWIFTFVSMLGGIWVSRLTTINLALVPISVVITTAVGWYWFDIVTYQANWSASSTADDHAITRDTLLCPWAFVGVELAAVSTGMVKDPKRTVPLTTIPGTAMTGIAYIIVTQVTAGMCPAPQMATSGASFAISTSTILGGWATPMVSALIAFVRLTSLGLWVMLADQVGVCATNDGNLPKVYDEADSNGILEKGLLLTAAKMTALTVLITLTSSAGGEAPDLFSKLTGIVVLLTILPYFYSCVDLIRFEGISTCNFANLICSILGCVFYFIVLMGASSFELVGAFIASLIILMFYGHKMHQRQNNATGNNGPANAH